MKFVQFDDHLESTWEEFCERSQQDTFLVTRRFLNYHKDRFSDKSLLIYSKDQLVALFPASEFGEHNKSIVSHPGITFGGLIHDGRIRGADFEAIYSGLAGYYSGRYKSMVVKPIPEIYQNKPNDDEKFGLFRVGAKKTQVNLSSAIKLTREYRVSSRRKRNFKKAMKSGLSVGHGMRFLDAFWEILEQNLKSKFGVTPTHSLYEIYELFRKFPDNLALTVALRHGKIVCGVITFSGENINHAQYIASNQTSNEIGGLDFLFQYLIEFSAKSGMEWFDFGTSNLDDSCQLNDGLYQFKSEFGGGGIAYEQYTLEL